MNEKNVINILIAVPERDSRLFTEQLKGTLKENPYFQVLHFYTVHAGKRSFGKPDDMTETMNLDEAKLLLGRILGKEE